jgi:sulfatase maturation enzyme AslB (radical SAM superfamily)
MDNLSNNKGNRLHINNDSLRSAWNCGEIKHARLKMIRGEPVSSCDTCTKKEERGYQSSRDTRDMEKNFNSTAEDGTVKHYPNHIELHFGNMCNLKCKMCGQQYSNQIGKELLQIGEQDPDWLKWVTKESGNVNIWTNNLSAEYRWFQNSKIKNKLFDYMAKHINDFNVIGGEPTIIPEFWELFTYLEERDRLKDMKITLNTNLTNINPKMTDWLPKLKQWVVWASIDGLGSRNEYIRFPSNFEKICDNLDFYKKLCDENDRIVLNPAIQILNIDQLDDILEWWLEFSDGGPSRKFGLSWVSQVWYPKMLNYDVAPPDYKLKIADKLEKSRGKFSNISQESIEAYDGHITNLRRDSVSENERKHLLQSFVKYNDRQDKFRGKTTWRKLIPDLEESITRYLSRS